MYIYIYRSMQATGHTCFRRFLAKISLTLTTIYCVRDSRRMRARLIGGGSSRQARTRIPPLVGLMITDFVIWAPGGRGLRCIEMFCGQYLYFYTIKASTFVPTNLNAAPGDVDSSALRCFAVSICTFVPVKQVN